MKCPCPAKQRYCTSHLWLDASRQGTLKAKLMCYGGTHESRGYIRHLFRPANGVGNAYALTDKELGFSKMWLRPFIINCEELRDAP